jgi:hypothetical protein
MTHLSMRPSEYPTHTVAVALLDGSPVLPLIGVTARRHHGDTVDFSWNEPASGMGAGSTALPVRQSRTEIVPSVCAIQTSAPLTANARTSDATATCFSSDVPDDARSPGAVVWSGDAALMKVLKRLKKLVRGIGISFITEKGFGIFVSSHDKEKLHEIVSHVKFAEV